MDVQATTCSGNLSSSRPYLSHWTNVNAWIHNHWQTHEKTSNLAVRFGKVAHNGTEEIVHFHQLSHELQLYLVVVSALEEMVRFLKKGLVHTSVGSHCAGEKRGGSTEWHRAGLSIYCTSIINNRLSFCRLRLLVALFFSSLQIEPFSEQSIN